MSAVGVIFANVNDADLGGLTQSRAVAGVPFGCRYRLIDFALSNMVNAGITRIVVAARRDASSLADHIGSGKDWDLARRSGGIKVTSPYDDTGSCATQLGTVAALSGFLERGSEEYVVAADCGVICNIDLKDVIKTHAEKGARMTAVVKLSSRAGDTAVSCDGGVRITDVFRVPENDLSQKAYLMNLWVADKNYLLDAAARRASRGLGGSLGDLVGKNLSDEVFAAYFFKGYHACFRSIAEYFKNSSDLLDPDVRKELFSSGGRQIFTNVKNSAPSLFESGSSVRRSLVADGCVVEGSVENSVLFRGVRIGRESVVQNCVLMQDTVVKDGARLNGVICDKNVIIGSGRVLSGHENMPYYITKNGIV